MRRVCIALLLATSLIAAACGDSSSATTSARNITDTTNAPRPIAGGDDQRRDPAPPVTSAPSPTYASEDYDDRRPDDTRFQDYGVNPYTDPARDELSTFAVDVDTGAYTLMRAWVRDGFLPDPASVRVEEYVNYFDGGYPAPERATFAVYADGGPTPFWDSRHDLLRIGIKAREVAERRRQDLNLTLVVDTSGSMGSQGKLATVKDALGVLVGQLDRFDRVAMVAYSSRAKVVLEPTPGDRQDEISDAIDDLHASGNTNAEAGLVLGYDLADEMYVRDGVNRVVLLSDGVANVGETGPDGILERIGDETRRGIDLVTVGVGIETYNDVLLEQLADRGNGWYAYVDTFDEAQRLFQDRLTTSLQTVARDVKVQVEFDPDLVDEYRLIGFENRDVRDRDFRDDEVDAGEVNAGHSVTALYEVALTRAAFRSDESFATVRVRWQDAADGRVEEIEGDVTADMLAGRYERTDPHFRLAATVAAYAEVLRHGSVSRGLTLGDVADEARRLPLRELDDERADEFVDLVQRADRHGR